MKNQRINIIVTKPQHAWLEREAKRLGMKKLGELVRRIIDAARDGK